MTRRKGRAASQEIVDAAAIGAHGVYKEVQLDIRFVAHGNGAQVAEFHFQQRLEIFHVRVGVHIAGVKAHVGAIAKVEEVSVFFRFNGVAPAVGVIAQPVAVCFEPLKIEPDILKAAKGGVAAAIGRHVGDVDVDPFVFELQKIHLAQGFAHGRGNDPLFLVESLSAAMAGNAPEYGAAGGQDRG